jgi:hypothetical protein
MGPDSLARLAIAAPRQQFLAENEQSVHNHAPTSQPEKLDEPRKNDLVHGERAEHMEAEGNHDLNDEQMMDVMEAQGNHDLNNEQSDEQMMDVM